MSIRYEWVAAPYAAVTYIPAGHYVDGEEGEYTKGDVLEEKQTSCGALVISYDEAIVIEGSVEELKAFAQRILDEIPEA